METNYLIFSHLSVLELTIKKFSNLPGLMLNFRAPISEGALLHTWEQGMLHRLASLGSHIQSIASEHSSVVQSHFYIVV